MYNTKHTPLYLEGSNLVSTCWESLFCSGAAYLGTRPGTVGIKNGADLGTLGGSFGLFFFWRENETGKKTSKLLSCQWFLIFNSKLILKQSPKSNRKIKKFHIRMLK